jgi:hypothetical protein
MVIVLNESTHLREQAGARWRATLITPGKGSSGHYSEQLLSTQGAAAFPAGTKLWFKHPAKGESAGGRDPREQWGFLPEAAKYTPGVGVEGEIEVLPHAKDIVESLGTQAALSVWVLGESDAEGNVTQLIPDVTNSVDMVAYPGRAGSGLTEKMYESLIAGFAESSGATSATGEREGQMDEKILEALVALGSKFDTFVAESKAAATAEVEAEAVADATEKAVKEAVDGYAEKVAAVNAAEGLLPSQVTALLEVAKEGKDVAPLIESAKKITDELTKHLTESNDRVLSGHAVLGEAASSDYAVGSWN